MSKDLKTFEELLGKRLERVELLGDKEAIIFELKDGYGSYKLYHSQDCCESVWIEDIDGDLNDLLHEPLLMAEEISGGSGTEPITGFEALNEHEESWTWTFYKLATIKGGVTIRFYGCSNGYYSEAVDFCKTSY